MRLNKGFEPILVLCCSSQGLTRLKTKEHWRTEWVVLLLMSRTTDYWHPERALFQKSRTFGLGQTFWAENFWGIWGIFGRTISTHFGIVSMFSIIQQLFLQKTWPGFKNPRKKISIVGIRLQKRLRLYCGPFHGGQMHDKKMACRTRPRITPQKQIFSYSQIIFVCHIRPKQFRFIWFMASLGVCNPWAFQWMDVMRTCGTRHGLRTHEG